jgi:hypothetical protein
MVFVIDPILSLLLAIAAHEFSVMTVPKNQSGISQKDQDSIDAFDHQIRQRVSDLIAEGISVEQAQLDPNLLTLRYKRKAIYDRYNVFS